MNGRVPSASDSWALFLDADGTLLDIASKPELVEVSPDLPALLARLARRLAGSVALVSGRSIADLDRLFHPFHFAAAGIHGAERRDACGEIHWAGFAPEDLEPARRELRRLVARHPALLLEDKGRGLALHFRQAPELEDEVRAVLERLLVQLPADAHLQPGHCVIEIKRGGVDKGTAIEQFMQEPPFVGRVPVFVGDDAADEAGLAYVESLGGHGIFVGQDPGGQRGWLPDARAVRAWLRGVAAAEPGVH
jgi:trehalose 6-phosphate phosphatase